MSRFRRFRLRRLFFETLENRSMLSASVPSGPLAQTEVVSPQVIEPAIVSEQAQAQITDTPLSGGVFQYTVSLQNTGNTPIGTFWYSWVPGEDFMPVAPTNIVSPSGWKEIVTNGGTSDG